MFIIDLDDTLLDTQAFKKAREHALVELGVSIEVYKKSYTEAYNNKFGQNTYNDAAHATVLAAYGFEKQVVQSSLEKVTARLRDFLFPDAVAFLQYLREKKHMLILLSLGEGSFQKTKIIGTGIQKFFDQVFTVNDSKEHVIETILTNGNSVLKNNIWFVNDKPQETEKITASFAGLRSVMKMSSNFMVEEYKSTGLPYFATLTEIKQYVEQQVE